MAMNSDILIPVPADQGSTAIIDVINSNFRTLAQRIKDLNNEFSYLDLMRISTIFTSGATEKTDILNSFIATVWGSLDNYAGVYIRLTGVNAYFEMKPNDKIQNGDYVVKIPGNQFLHISGMAPQIYAPSWTEGHPFTINYVAVSEEPGQLPSLNIPTTKAGGITVGATTTVVNDGESIPNIPNNAEMRDVRWYTENGEEVVWDATASPQRPASYCSKTNYTTLRLNATYIYYVPTNDN